MLTLSLAVQPGYAELRSEAHESEALSALRLRFTSAAQVSPTSFTVELEDFLLNIFELHRWPGGDANVNWQSELQRLVVANYQDSARVRTALGGAQPAGRPLARTDGLREFQISNAERLLALAHGANFSVPGAGKTRTTLAVFDTCQRGGDVSRLLVVAPKSAFSSWDEEAAEWFDRPAFFARYEGRIPPEASGLLVNYERLPDARSDLMRWVSAAPTMLVLDEAHRTKRGDRGVWGAVCLALAPLAVRRLILTGTPAPNGAPDLESLFAFVWPGQGRQQVTAALADGDLRRASSLLAPLYVRTTKDQLGLPPYRPVVRRVELPALHARLYAALAGTLAVQAPQQGGDRLQRLGRVVLYLLMGATTPALLSLGAHRYEPLAYRIPPLDPPPGSDLEALAANLTDYEMPPKYREAAAIVAANAALGRKTIVWSTFIRNLTTLQRMLSAYRPALVHGGTPDRDAEILRFRRDPDCLVLLSNPATLGEGISLHHECSDAVYLDRDFAAGRYLQSLDRIHRLGLPPDAQVRVTVLVAAGTIDEVVEQRLGAKLDFMGGVLADPAVTRLGDIDEEPEESAGMTDDDLALVLRHLDAHRPT
jgi:SNF2 family DNA or RNA helicase